MEDCGEENETIIVDVPKLESLLGDIVFDTGVKSPLGGLNPSNPNFDSIGKQFLRFFIDHARLHNKSKVLDIGCGTGRIAKQMLNFLDGGSYTGIDVNRRFIEYCQNTYKSKKFKFDHIDLQHDEYNVNGKIDQRNFTLPYKNGAFNFVCAVAIFNHCNFSCISRYIEEISRVLSQQGTFFGTFILLNQQSMEIIDSKTKHPFKFDLRHHDGWYEYTTRKYWNVAVPEMGLRRVFIKNKLMIHEPIRYGEWVKSRAAITGHDVITAIKGQWR